MREVTAHPTDFGNSDFLKVSKFDSLLPELSKEILQVARKQQLGEVTEHEHKLLRNRYWAASDTLQHKVNNSHGQIDDCCQFHIRALRASTVCLRIPNAADEGWDDVGNCFGLFIELVNAIEDHSPEIEQLLHKHFENVESQHRRR